MPKGLAFVPVAPRGLSVMVTPLLLLWLSAAAAGAGMDLAFAFLWELAEGTGRARQVWERPPHAPALPWSPVVPFPGAAQGLLCLLGATAQTLHGLQGRARCPRE